MQSIWNRGQSIYKSTYNQPDKMFIYTLLYQLRNSSPEYPTLYVNEEQFLAENDRNTKNERK